MKLSNIIRKIVHNRPDLKIKLKKADSKQTPFQYVYQSLFMTILSVIAFLVIAYLLFSRDILLLALIFTSILTIGTFIFYQFWIHVIDVQVSKLSRELDGDLLFVSEYFLVSLESGMPLGNSIQRLAQIKRPGGRFFNRVYTDFKTGKDLEDALQEASVYSPSDSLRVLIKRLKDSLSIGVDLRQVLENFIIESSAKKEIEIKSFSKKLNPLIMMYLILGVVAPSLGITFFILGAAMLEITPDFLRIILIFIFLLMFAFQYIAYSSFKFSKATL